MMDAWYASLRSRQPATQKKIAGRAELAVGDPIGDESSFINDARGAFTLTIVIRPDRPERYRAYLHGKPLAKRGWCTPFFTAARKLLAFGIDSAMTLAMMHEGTRMVSMPSKCWITSCGSCC
jgi:hypothetical protein